jgi:salicylate hydroxylase
LKVLAAVGLEFADRSIEKCAEYTSGGELLGGFDFSSLREKYGFPSFGMRRAVLLQRLKDHAGRQGVQVLEGWELQDTRESENGIIAVAKDGREIEASFLVGCDGLRSATRSLICQRHGMHSLAADYTGLVMVSILDKVNGIR